MRKYRSKLVLDVGTFRFARIAVAREYITREQAQNAIREQEEDHKKGAHRFLGMILMDSHLITGEQMESILAEMAVGWG